jgi:hypothetical protein
LPVGAELPAKSSKKTPVSKNGAAESAAIDPDLALIGNRWPELTPHAKMPLATELIGDEDCTKVCRFDAREPLRRALSYSFATEFRRAFARITSAATKFSVAVVATQNRPRLDHDLRPFVSAHHEQLRAARRLVDATWRPDQVRRSRSFLSDLCQTWTNCYKAF